MQSKGERPEVGAATPSRSVAKQPSLEDFHSELKGRASRGRLQKQAGTEWSDAHTSPLTVSQSQTGESHSNTGQSISHISLSSAELVSTKRSGELVKQLSSEIEQKLADSAPIRTKQRSPRKGEGMESPLSAVRKPKDGAKSGRRRDSIAAMQQRHQRASPSKPHLPTADPVADAPPPPSGKLHKFDPLVTPPVTYSRPPWTLTLRKEVGGCGFI